MGRKDKKKIPGEAKPAAQVEEKSPVPFETQPSVQPVTEKLSFQDELNALLNGAVQQLWPQEYAGPIILKNAITIEGNGATIWALKGPVVSLQCPGVMLRNVKVECTGEDTGHESDRYALLIEPGIDFELNDVEVRGLVKGIPSEEGEWRYPLSLSLGALLCKHEYQYRLRLVVPVPCRIQSTISGIETIPQQLVPGLNEVILHIENLPQDILISGLITIKTDLLKRSFSLYGIVNDFGNPPIDAQEIPVLWEPADWAGFAPRVEEIQPENAVGQDDTVNPADLMNLNSEILTPELVPTESEAMFQELLEFQRTQESASQQTEINPVPVEPEVIFVYETPKDEIPNDIMQSEDENHDNPIANVAQVNESAPSSIPVTTPKADPTGEKEIPVVIPTSKPVRTQHQLPSVDAFRLPPPKVNPEKPLPNVTAQPTIFSEFLGLNQKQAVKTGENQPQAVKQPAGATNERPPNHQNPPKATDTKPDKNPVARKQPPGIGSAFGVK